MSENDSMYGTSLYSDMCCNTLEEYAWLVYCHDEYDILQVHSVFTREEHARSFVRAMPYYYVCDLTGTFIKYKIKN